MDVRAPLLAAVLLAAPPAHAAKRAVSGPPADAEEEAEPPCSVEPETGVGREAAPGSDVLSPTAPRPAPDRRPCRAAAAPDGRAPGAAPGRAPAPPPPPADPERDADRTRRRASAGKNAQREAQTLVESLAGDSDDGLPPAQEGRPGAPSPAFVGSGSPDGGMTEAEFRRLNDTPPAAGPTTLESRSVPGPAGAPATAPPPQAEEPLWRRAWKKTVDVVDRYTPSPYKLADDVSYEASQKFKDTSSSNTEQDAWRHARWHQRMVDSLCPETGRSVCAPVAAGVALAAGTIHELMGAASGQPAAEFKMDMNNNWKGTLAGIQGADARLIDEALASGQLVVLTPSAPPTPMVARR